MRVVRNSSTNNDDDDEFKPSETYINGLTNYRLLSKQNIRVEESDYIGHVDYNGSGDRTYVHFKYFPPGTVLLLKVTLNQSACDQLKTVRQQLAELIVCQFDNASSNKRLLLYSRVFVVVVVNF